MTTEHRKNKGGRQLKKEDIPISDEKAEIKVTEEMIEAALPVFFEYDARFSNERTIVTEIYRAMLTRRNQAQPKSRL